MEHGSGGDALESETLHPSETLMALINASMNASLFDLSPLGLGSRLPALRSLTKAAADLANEFSLHCPATCVDVLDAAQHSSCGPTAFLAGTFGAPAAQFVDFACREADCAFALAHKMAYVAFDCMSEGESWAAVGACNARCFASIEALNALPCLHTAPMPLDIPDRFHEAIGAFNDAVTPLSDEWDLDLSLPTHLNLSVFVAPIVEDIARMANASCAISTCLEADDDANLVFEACNPELAAIRDVTKITLSFDSIASLPICADGCADAVSHALATSPCFKEVTSLASADLDIPAPLGILTELCVTQHQCLEAALDSVDDCTDSMLNGVCDGGCYAAWRKFSNISGCVLDSTWLPVSELCSSTEPDVSMCASAAPEVIAAACAEDECAASCTTGLAASLGSTVHGGGYCVQLRDGYGDYTAEHHAMIARADKYLAFSTLCHEQWWRRRRRALPTAR